MFYLFTAATWIAFISSALTLNETTTAPAPNFMWVWFAFNIGLLIGCLNCAIKDSDNEQLNEKRKVQSNG